MRSQRLLFAGPGLKIGAAASALTIVGAVVLEALPHLIPFHFPLGVALEFSASLTIVGLQWDIFNIVRTTTETRNRANILMEALEVADLQEDELVRLCNAAAGISSRRDLPRWVIKDVELIISTLSESFGELDRNKMFKLANEERLMYYLKTLSQTSTGSILATSALEGVDSTFWDSEDGKAYLNIQKQTKRQHPKMTLRRIFLLSHHDLEEQQKNAILKKTVLRHEEAGFEVGVLTQSKLQDVVIFDDKAAVFSARGAQGEAANGGIADFDQERIALQTEEFNRWWETADNNRRNYWPDPEQAPAK